MKKPGKRATQEALQQYAQDRKRFNLSTRFVQSMAHLRTALDQAGGERKILAIAVDGSFCNRTVLADAPERSVLDCRLPPKTPSFAFPLRPAAGAFMPEGGFTPEQVRQDDRIAWRGPGFFYGGKRLKVRYKEVSNVLWQHGAKTQPLRLFVIAPTPYRKRKSSKLSYRQPAFLLCTDPTSSAPYLQIYLDRWQIEVNHREEKDTLGVGQAQLWNSTAVPKQPVLVVAAYSALLLAALKAFGATRGAACADYPNGGGAQNAPPASISLRYSEKKLPNTLNWSPISTFTLIRLTLSLLLPHENARKSRPMAQAVEKQPIRFSPDRGGRRAASSDSHRGLNGRSWSAGYAQISAFFTDIAQASTLVTYTHRNPSAPGAYNS